jgi:hypothetical protein
MILLYWCFAAIANFERMDQNNKMTITAWILALPIIVFGIVLDWYLNLTFVSFLMLDPFHFGTVSQRMKKYNEDDKEYEWRKKFAEWLKPLLDPLDPSGRHI